MGEPKFERIENKLELPPKLRLVSVSARSVEEAIHRAPKNAAGEDELQEMLNWLNPNRLSSTAKQWGRTCNYFPKAAGLLDVPVIVRDLGFFYRAPHPRNFGWLGKDNRLVVKD